MPTQTLGVLAYVRTLGTQLGTGGDAGLPLEADGGGRGGDGGGGGGGGYPGDGGVAQWAGQGGDLEVQSVGRNQRHRDEGEVARVAASRRNRSGG